MKLGDLVDIAWSWILDQMPMMADPQRYRTLLFEGLWLGKQPEYTAEERKALAARQAADVKRGVGQGFSDSDRQALADLMKRAEELREKQKSAKAGE